MNKNIYRILYSFCSCVIGILIITFSAIIFFGFSSNNEVYMETLRNWEKSPIVDLEVIKDPTINCSLNQTSVFLFNWQGTEEGCLCTSTNQIVQGKCCSQSSLNEEDCCFGTSINPIESKVLDLWSFSSLNKKIKFRLCATRLNNYSYKNNSPRSAECLASEKWCGKDQNGDKDINYGFCVPVNQKCPIQEILIGDINPNPKIYESITIKEENGKKIQIFVNREGPSKLPMIDFRLSASNTVCLDENENVGINQGYKLNKSKSKCSLVDHQYVNTSISIDQKDFLESNYISEQLQSLPNYQYSSDKLYLYAKSYTVIKMSCRSNISQFYESVDTLDKIRNLSLPIIILCSIYASILLLFETWIGFKYNKFSWGVIIFKKNVSIFLQIFYILKFILFLVCNTVIIIEACYQFQINEFSKDIQNKQCMEMTSDFFTFLSSGKIKEYSIAIILCLWMHMLTEPNIFYIINKYCCSQIQQRMQQSMNTYSIRNQSKHTPPSNKEVSIIIEKQEEKKLPQNYSFSQYPQLKSPNSRIKNPSQFFQNIKKTVSYKNDNDRMQ